MNRKNSFKGLLLVFITALLWMAFFIRDPARIETTMPPKGFDQDVNLDIALEFARNLTVSRKVPVYTMWLGGFAFLSGRDKQVTFWTEKYASIFIFGFLIGCLGLALFDARTGMFLTFWAMNCKYLVNVRAGSNPMAASLFVASLLCLINCRGRARLPLALLLLFLSSLARPEMRLPFYGVLLFLLARAALRFKREGVQALSPQRGAVKHWAALMLICLGLSVFINRHAQSDPWSIANAYFEAFAVNYARRTNTAHLYPNGWPPFDETIHRVMPKVPVPITSEMKLSTLVQAVRDYPGEALANLLFNIKMFFFVVPAVLFGLFYKGLMVAALLLYAGSYYLKPRAHESRWRGLAPEVKRDLALWAASTLLLVPATLLVFTEARYYLPMIPVLMCLLILLFQELVVMKLIFRRGQKSPFTGSGVEAR